MTIHSRMLCVCVCVCVFNELFLHLLCCLMKIHHLEAGMGTGPLTSFSHFLLLCLFILFSGHSGQLYHPNLSFLRFFIVAVLVYCVPFFLFHTYGILPFDFDLFEFTNTTDIFSHTEVLARTRVTRTSQHMASVGQLDLLCGLIWVSLFLGTSEVSCSVAQSCLTLCDPMDCSTPGFPVFHHFLELAQTHVP